jgi:hypothetical protein
MLCFLLVRRQPVVVEKQKPTADRRRWVFGKIVSLLHAAIPTVRRAALDHQGAHDFRHVRQALDSTIDGGTDHSISYDARKVNRKCRRPSNSLFEPFMPCIDDIHKLSAPTSMTERADNRSSLGTCHSVYRLREWVERVARWTGS